MWYFSWILGLAAALGFGILNALWLEFTSDASNDIDSGGIGE